MSLIPAILITTLAGLAILGLMELWQNWSLSRAASRPVERARYPERHTSQSPARLEPESQFIVRLSESEVVCERPDGKVERVAWNDLQKVEVITTSDGPMSPDVFWLLRGSDGGCAIPQGATGERELLDRLQALPGFDNKNVIEAMLSVADRKFLCWQRAA